ncbi:unnamed protein product [Callosobruchus maculatus]|uniref:Peptidase S1 domain-containing protein n=1 Tax=Callosobruchus maculatus TaxID=64391 RepID=A0A653CGP1_CALMS|nr:unnamed protein product [Callosobruchus maculatus]
MPNTMWSICICLVLVLTFVESFPQNGGISQYFSTKPEVSIINGEVCTPHCMPFIVGINLETAYVSDFCSGSLISPNYVLTAAHCLERAIQAEVVFGAHNITENEPTQIRQRVTTDDFIIYPGWRGEKVLTHDLALIRLPQSVTENEYIKVVKLATGSNRFVDRTGSVGGWGITKNGQTTITPLLRYIDAAIMSNKACRLVDSSYRNIIGPTHLCLSGTTSRGQVGTCIGDSGGPLSVSGYFSTKPEVSIINGEVCTPHCMPFIVGINLETTYGSDFCSGSLISPNYVLTAAHCLEIAIKAEVVFGAHDITVNEPTQVRQWVKTDDFIIHPGWRGEKVLTHDLALIRLPQPVAENGYIKIVKLATGTNRFVDKIENLLKFKWRLDATIYPDASQLVNSSRQNHMPYTDIGVEEL